MAPPPLLGPPERRDPNPNPKLKTITTSGPSNPFMDGMISSFNESTKVNAVDPSPEMGTTEKGSATYFSSGNPCLDFFFHAVPNTPEKTLERWLQSAWDRDAPTTLKLICNLRGVRGTGKSDKEGFYTAAMWLHGRHPKTLACNLHAFSRFGYLKDFPEILYRLLEGSDVRKIQKAEWMQRKNGSGKRSGGWRAPFTRSSYRGHGSGNGRSGERKKKKPAATRELRIANAEKRNQAEKARASMERKQRRISMANRAVIRYQHDPNYRFLHERVTDLFADHLKRDVEHMNAGETNGVSLAAKWCPSLDSSFDRATLLCEGIARKIFPRESCPEYESVEEAHYAYRIRDRLRKEILVPLRRVLSLPEVYMAGRDWKSLPYNRVASVAMKTYKEIFLKHDAERFQKFLNSSGSGKKTVAAGALLPHEIIAALDDGDGGLVAERQWKRMVDDLKKGSLKNCIAVSDVSRSMEGTPMEASIALGLLVSELSEDPWRGKLITFSENPELQSLQGSDLRAKTEFVRAMNWGSNTDLQRVFDLILRVAVEGELKPEEMVKRVFVFSDMEFDKAIGEGHPNRWETDHEEIKRKYREKGYGEAIPEMVFWNLRDSRATPAKGRERGVAMVSGFSKNLIKLFLGSHGEIDPMRIMEAAISGDEYENLFVID